MAEKYLDYSGTDLLWKKILSLLDRKIDNIVNADDSIEVTNKNEIAVNISASEDNILQLKPGEGLYVKGSSAGRMHKLTFGSDKNYVYDGSEDVTVPVYGGNYSE